MGRAHPTKSTKSGGPCPPYELMTPLAQTKCLRGARAPKLLEYLRGNRERAVPARELADACDIPSCNVEIRRRRVREVVEYARTELGEQICASGDGYWLARNASEWLAYRDAQKANIRFAFVRLRRVDDAVRDRVTRQGKLFEMRGMPV